MKVRRTAALLAPSVIAVLVAAAGYEIWARVQYDRWRSRFDNFGWIGKMTIPSLNRRLLWEYRPYGEYHGAMGDIVVNRYGFREIDLPRQEKPDDVYRVAFIGDSVTLGILNRPEDTFEQHFEAHAGSMAQQRVQALNFGVDGYDAIQVSELLSARVQAFEPDCIVYTMCLNDFDSEWSSGEKHRYFVEPRSFLAKSIEAQWIRLRRIDLTEHCFRRNRSLVFEAIGAMNATAKERGQLFVVALVPSFDATSFADYKYETLHREIETFLTGGGVQHLDLLDAFRGSRRDPAEVSFDIWHPNATGNEIIGKALADAVVRSLIRIE